MILTITASGPGAADLSYLLHKHPDRLQQFELSFGKAHVFYPQAGTDRTTVALLLDIDPIGLVRGRRGAAKAALGLDQYVNDRPFVASSFMSVAIADVFGTAMAGRCEARPDAIDSPMHLEATIAAVPCRGGAEMLKSLFEPLGYEVIAEGRALDEKLPAWGESHYYALSLRRECKLQDLLKHLYVLIPVFDGYKHYWIGEEELEKLLRHGEGWLAAHPQRELITRRYLKRQGSLVRQALERLTLEEDPALEEKVEAQTHEEEEIEKRVSLNEQRLGTVMAALRQSAAKKVVDLGCGEGKLLAAMLKDRQFEQIVGMDVSHRSLDTAEDRLRLERMPRLQRERIQLIHGSLMYRDRRLEGFDAATAVEVIEHLDPPRLAAFERVVFEFARPARVIITTPNAEYNVMWESMPAGQMRHRDHRFEWTRAEFRDWGRLVAERFGYDVVFISVGAEDANVGSPTQMGIFSQRNAAAA